MSPRIRTTYRTRCPDLKPFVAIARNGTSVARELSPVTTTLPLRSRMSRWLDTMLAGVLANPLILTSPQNRVAPLLVFQPSVSVPTSLPDVVTSGSVSTVV